MCACVCVPRSIQACHIIRDGFFCATPVSTAVTPRCHSHNTVRHRATESGVSQKTRHAGPDGVEEHLTRARKLMDGRRSGGNFVVSVPSFKTGLSRV